MLEIVAIENSRVEVEKLEWKGCEVHLVRSDFKKRNPEVKAMKLRRFI